MNIAVVVRMTGGGGAFSSGVPKTPLSEHQNGGSTVPTRERYVPATRTCAVGFSLPPGCSAPATKRWPPGRTCTSEARSVEIHTPRPPALATRSIWPSPPGCVTSCAGADAWRVVPTVIGAFNVTTGGSRESAGAPDVRSSREERVESVAFVWSTWSSGPYPMATVPRSGAHSSDISSASAADPVEASKSGPDTATTPMTKATPMMTSATAGRGTPASAHGSMALYEERV